LAVWRAFLDAHASITQTLEQELLAERDLPLTWYDVLLHLSEAGGRRLTPTGWSNAWICSPCVSPSSWSIEQ